MERSRARQRQDSQDQGFSKAHKVELFRVVVSTHRTDWVRLTDVARKANQTIYRIKHGLLDNYLRQELGNPAVRMAFA
jgi:hypothetical protein